MDASDYTRYGDYRCDLVLDTMAAAAVVVVVDNVCGYSATVVCDFPREGSAIDSGDK